MVEGGVLHSCRRGSPYWGVGMTDRPVVHLRKNLTDNLTIPVWPAGIRPEAFDAAQHLNQAHGLLVAAYRYGGGQVGPFEEWWSDLRQDSDYDPSVFFVALDDDNRVIGLAQCWTSGFLKDLAVAEVWRRRGLGKALLLHAFVAFQARGVQHFELKVEIDNPTGAGRLYQRLGMAPVT